MTRIIAGSAGGRRLQVPPAGTRPTSDRVREALFSALSARLDFTGMRVLDLYAGSGALGLEALSRGAAYTLFAESDRRAAAVIKANLAALALPGTVRQTRVASLLDTACDNPFGLVLYDPPYALADGEVAADLRALLANGWIAPETIVVVERSSRSAEIEWPAGLVADKTRRYGETQLSIAMVGG